MDFQPSTIEKRSPHQTCRIDKRGERRVVDLLDVNIEVIIYSSKFVYD